MKWHVITTILIDSFLKQCVPFSMLGGPDETKYWVVHFVPKFLLKSRQQLSFCIKIEKCYCHPLIIDNLSLLSFEQSGITNEMHSSNNKNFNKYNFVTSHLFLQHMYELLIVLIILILGKFCKPSGKRNCSTC